jgi:hypothetical protein
MTPTICVTSDAPTFRMLIKNNGNNGKSDGQLAIYLNFTGADGKAHQVKNAALTSKKPGWTLSPKIFVHPTHLHTAQRALRPDQRHRQTERHPWQLAGRRPLRRPLQERIEERSR